MYFVYLLNVLWLYGGDEVGLQWLCLNLLPFS
jgi:hypothetical protein